MKKLRVILISHIYLEPRSRGKLAYLADLVDLQLISPHALRFAFGLRRAEFADGTAYQTRVFPCWFPAGIRTSTRWILASRDLGFREFEPDIIHVENEVHSFSVQQAIIYRRIHAPRARTIVFGWHNQATPGCKGVLVDALSALTMPGIDHFITGNQDAFNLLEGKGVSRDRQSLIPAVGVDLEHFRPARPEERAQFRASLDLQPEEMVIGFAGRFVPDKGIAELIDAVTLLNNCGGQRLRLLCVGDGPMKATLEQNFPQVITASPGGSSAVLPYYQAMDVLVLPSRSMAHWKEQFGLVLAEAMACGVPVVGSSSGAIPEVIGDAGLIFREGCADELAECLGRLRDSPNLRRQLSQAGMRRVALEYSDRVIAQRTFDAYQNLMGRK